MVGILRKSLNVRNEARLGYDRKILIPVLIDSASASLGFGSIQAESFSWGKLKIAVAHLASASQLPEKITTIQTPSETANGSKPGRYKLVKYNSELPFEPKMVTIPAGSFQMGSKPAYSEQPIHNVTIAKPFRLGKFPVTFAEYDVFAHQTKRQEPNNYDKGCDRRRPSLHPPPGHDCGWGRGRRPAINVSWDDAIAYASWLSQKIGKVYRLPSEAEWEYACRAGTKSSFFWGEDELLTKDYAWFAENDGNMTHPVGEKQANPWGLHDMIGNIGEWLQDTWHETYEGAPDDGSAWVNRNDYMRAVRGGSGTSASYLRSGIRESKCASYRGCVGFRLAQDLP